MSPTNYAICQADLLIKNDQQAKVYLGNSLIPTMHTARNRVTSFLKTNSGTNAIASPTRTGNGLKSAPRRLGQGLRRWHVKIFRREDFAYHKVKVVFWQTDENDQPAIITERYEKTFTAANVAREQAFYDSDLTFLINLKSEGGEKVVELALTPKDNASRKLKAALGNRPGNPLRSMDAPSLRAR